MIAHHWIDSILGRPINPNNFQNSSNKNVHADELYISMKTHQHNNTKTDPPPLLHQQSFYWDLSMEICLKGIPCGIVHELAATAISYISHLCLDANSWKHCQEAWQEILVSLLHFKRLYHKNPKSPQSLPTAKDLTALLNRGNPKGEVFPDVFSADSGFPPQ